MKFLIRCDSSFLIGHGHLARCIAFAKRLRDLSHEVVFSCLKLEGNRIDLIENNQFKVCARSVESFVAIADSSSTWIPSSKDDADEFIELCKSEKPDWVILDHYSIDLKWEQQVSKVVEGKLFVIDDSPRQHCAAAVLDQGLSEMQREKWTKAQSDTETKIFLGPSYALLDSKFSKQLVKKTNSKKKLLVFFGGVDHVGAVGRFLSEWELYPISEIEVNVLVGQGYRDLDGLRARCEKLKLNVIPGTSDVASILSETDFFLGSGGMITWERAFFGIPSIVVAVADNQVPSSKYLAELGVHTYLGHIQDVSFGAMMFELSKLINSSEICDSYRGKSMGLKVGEGIGEITSFLRNYSK